ncbi:hypothetical protein ACIPYS_14895 [Kitasatospora sp. NPDC089913]|uniref:hypothetical protein n=1 Tax=Kitasatospora sp. NPDC089913 TaxID=3364080 RepID=UPI0037FBBBC8
MRLRPATTALLAGLALVLTAPAAGCAAAVVGQIDIDGSRSGAVAVPGHDLVSPGVLTRGGSADGSVTVGAGG